jgi:hypothetical protein
VPRTRAAGILIGYAAGSLTGIFAQVSEALALRQPLRPETLAAYGIIGGIIGALSRGLLGFFPRRLAALGTLAALFAFAGLDVLYVANVRWLPAESYRSTKSLLVDTLVMSATFAVAWLFSRAWRPHAVGVRLRSAAAALGVVLLTANVATVARSWPHGSSDPLDRRGSGPDLLLVIMDSVKRDRLGLLDYRWPTTPSLDRLGREGRLYEAAFSGSSWTVPSVENILLGPNGGAYAAELRRYGYATACFTDNPHLTPRSDPLRGLDRVERSVGDWRRPLAGTLMGQVLERLEGGDDERLVDRAAKWAGTVRSPVFLYVHLMDSHTPYDSDPIDGRRRGGRHIEFPLSGMSLTSEEAEDIVARYDGGVRRADYAVGRLFEAFALRRRPFLAVITADHGESLGEGNRWFHGTGLSPELLEVPLMVVGDGVRAGRVSSPVGQAAIMPTLLRAAGIACPGCSSTDLRSTQGEDPIDGGLPPRLRYRISNGYELVVDNENGQRMLFRLGDSGEDRDLSRELPRVAETLAIGLASDSQRRHSPEQPGDFRGLGYLPF